MCINNKQERVLYAVKLSNQYIKDTNVFDDDNNDEYGVLDTEFKQAQFFNSLHSKCIKRLSDNSIVVQSSFYSIDYENKEIFIDSTNKNMQNELYSLIKNKKLTCHYPVKHWIHKLDLLSTLIVSHDNNNIKYVLSLLDHLDYNNVLKLNDSKTYLDHAIESDVIHTSRYVLESLVSKGCMPSTIENFNYLKNNNLLEYYSADMLNKLYIAMSFSDGVIDINIIKNMDSKVNISNHLTIDII